MDAVINKIKALIEGNGLKIEDVVKALQTEVEPATQTKKGKK